jgi:hypothetical protein
MASSERCIVNVGVGGWYPKGSERLRRTLAEVGEDANQFIYIDRLPVGAVPHHENMYAFKAVALERAASYGYRYLLWLDSSIYATKRPCPVWDAIIRDGYYFVDNGYNLAQTASNRLLNAFGISRDHAEQVPEITTCCFGLDIGTDKGDAVLKQFCYAAKQGLFNGNRVHDPTDSEDPRFLFCRHDQSALSLIADLFGMKPNGKYNDLLVYRHDEGGVMRPLPESVCLVNWGHME